MPSRNRIKIYAPESYYHIYNRGLNKRVIFKDSGDYAVFLNLLKRYLGREQVQDSSGRPYDSLHSRLELLAFCLMPNHFHLLTYQKDDHAITELMRRVCTSYSSYFNKRYKRTGPLFQERFKASRISRDEYLLHISRYIHLNPANFKKWDYSSLNYYVGNHAADWVEPKRIMDLFDGDNYLDFLMDYKNHKRMLDEVKYELADYIPA